MALAAFGPYVAGSIRTEQAVVYLMVLGALPTLSSFARSGAPYVMAWCGILFSASLSTIVPVAESLPWEPGNYLAGLDNFLLPLAVMLIVWTRVGQEDAVTALRSVARVTVWASAVNALIAIVSTQVSIEPLLRPFWGPGSAETTVAYRAQTMGRFSGIFNQPAEAGLVYSLALLLAIWLYARRPAFLYLATTLIALGGVLTVSKIFVFIGLPLGVWYLLRGNGLGAKIRTLAVIVTAFTIVSKSEFVQAWDGLEYFKRLFDTPQGDLIGFYTAGRWDSGSDVLGIIDVVLQTRPLAGLGFAGLGVAYDSSWTEIIVVSGLIGATFMAMILGGIIVHAKDSADPGVRVLTFLVGFLLIAASFGISALTANRAATVVWLLLALLVLARIPRGYPG